MIVWLASYPRSGSTLCRAILKRCFDLPTRALYNAGDDRVLGAPEVRAIVGHESGGADGPELIAQAQASDSVQIIKTHEPPLTKDPVIHIVRDGRAALVSYRHYLNQIERVPVSLDTVIRGYVFAGSWSQHFRSLQDFDNRLLLRFEDLVADPDGQAQKIGAFIGLRPKARFDLDFDAMKPTHPAFFRAGNDAQNIAEMAQHEALYWRLHGEVARELGYGEGEAPRQAEARSASVR